MTDYDQIPVARRWITNNIERLFDAEIANEGPTDDHGITPATLTSTIDSLSQGGVEVFDFLTDADLIALLMVRDLVPGDTEVRDLYRDPQ